MSLMDLAQQSAAPPADEPGAAPAFQRPNLGPGIAKAAAAVGMPPAQLKDQVDRIVAAGEKIMYSPGMKAERDAAVNGSDPIPQRLAENVVGLTLTMDKQAKGGLPEAAIFPAAMELLGEAADLLTHAGQAVSQDDFNQAARGMFVLIGKKLGMQGPQIMDAAKQGMAGGNQAAPDPGAQPPAAPPGPGMPPQGAPQ